MRLGIHPVLKREAGGIYQYGVTMLEAIDAIVRDVGPQSDRWMVLAHDIHDPALRGLSRQHWDIKPFRRPGSGEGTPAADRPDPDRPARQEDMTAWMRECGIDLMIYPAPHRLSFESEIPFVMAIHDLQHRLQPEFAEVSADGEWERREYLFRNAVRKATLLIAESEVGREDILQNYGAFGATPEMVRVLPYLPAPAAEGVSLPALRSKFAIPGKFFFYPAQFWPHKNHLRIVQALCVLKREKELSPSVVFAGSASGLLREKTRAEVLGEAERLGVRPQLIDIGYVSDGELTGLYQAATALVMPTFFGPTNIPILEAWTHRCPVLTSDIRGVRDQAGDAALLVDPRSVESIAQGMERLWREEDLRHNLVARGTRRAKEYTTDDYRRRLRDIIADARNRVRHGGCVGAGA